MNHAALLGSAVSALLGITLFRRLEGELAVVL